MATLVERRSQFHRANLIGHANPWNLNFSDMYHRVEGLLSHYSSNVAGVMQRAFGVINVIINPQAKMMAYNDVSFVLMAMFIFIFPFVLFFSGKKEET